MEKYVYIDSLITLLIFVLSSGILVWLIRFVRKINRTEFRKALCWVIPLVSVTFIDLFICLAIIIMLPRTPSQVNASDGSYLGKVVIEWKPSANSKSYSVLRANQPEGRYIEIAGNISKTSYIDTSVRPGRYYYKVIAKNDIGSSLQSKPDPGNPGITDYDFFKMFQVTEQSALSKLKKMGTLGYETQAGNDSGNTTYDARFDGRAHVVSSYVNYSDFDKSRGNHMVLNGSFNTEVDMLGSGTLTGKIDVSGNYSGNVTYNLVLSYKKKAGGYYVVIQSGKKAGTTIPWNYQ